MSARPGAAPAPAEEGTRPAAGTERSGLTTPRAAGMAGVAATLLMLVAVDGPSLWTDEAATVSAATRPLPELLRMAGTIDAVHTTYYLLVHGWVAVLGTSELALRSLSALAVGVAAAGTYVLGARLGGTRWAVAGAVTFVLLPRVTWMGVEARPYAAVTAVAVWATVVLGTALDRRRRRWWAGYAALVCLAVLLNLYAVLVVAGHALTVLLLGARAPERRAWLLAVLVGLLPTAPLVLTARAQSAQLGENGVGLVALVRNVVVNQFFLGETPTIFSRTASLRETSTGVGSAWRIASVLLAGLVALLVASAVLRVVRAGRPWPPRAVALAAWTGPWIVVPTGALALWAVVSQTYSPRYAAFSAPAVALVLGAAVLAVHRWWLRWAVVAVLVVCAVPVWVSQRAEHAKSGADWRETAAAVGAACGPGDAVYFSPRAQPEGELVRLTTRGVRVAYPGPFAGLDDVTLVTTPTEAGDLLGTSRRLEDARPALAGVGRLCVVRRHDYPRQARDADDALLDSLGLDVESVWTGPLDEVVVRGRR